MKYYHPLFCCDSMGNIIPELIYMSYYHIHSICYIVVVKVVLYFYRKTILYC